MADGETIPLLDSQTHREVGAEAGGAASVSGRRSLVGTCCRCCLATATLPLVLFRRRRSDEV